MKSLEAGDIELEVALARFEEGVNLMRACNDQLEAAERRIEILVGQAEGLVARPFEVADAEASEPDPDGDEEEG